METQANQKQQQQFREPTTGFGADIFNKIQLRAQILAEAQNQQAEADTILKEKQKELAVVAKEARAVRREYLQEMIQLHTKELENEFQQEEIRKCKASTEQLRIQEEQILKKMNEEKSKWESTVEGKLIENRVQLELYKAYLSGSIQEGLQAIERRNQKIEATSKLAEDLKHEQETIEEKQNVVRSEIQSITREEDSTNKLIEDLALQVRNSLTKRSELRITLRDLRSSASNNA